MSDDKLPAGPDDDGRHLPVPRGNDRLPSHAHHSTLPLDLYREERDEEEDGIDLLAYWRMLVKRRWLILGVTAGALALSLLATLLMPSIYRATAILAGHPYHRAG